MLLRSVFLLVLGLLATRVGRADDGYRLWLKYDRVADLALRRQYQAAAGFVASTNSTPTLRAASAELRRGLGGLLGQAVPAVASPHGRGVLLRVGAAGNEALKPEGYRIFPEGNHLVISSATDRGVLYGSFALLRQVQMHRPLAGLRLRSSPRIDLRLLNHWDNPSGTVERGYAGSSIWQWFELPERLDPRYADYARANASVGINGVVLNNVNASARYLTPEYVGKVAAVAAVLRPYGQRVYLSVFWAAPKVLGGLPTADPLDARVQQWWAATCDEIYRQIPDFGGFLVKANSEGEPGPGDYHRSHAEGANMLAQALGRHPGVVMWRAFVYQAGGGDRFKQAYEEFQPLDGQFDPRVLVQVKNGPIDFQAREPFHPLFGAMPRTPLLLEVQLTQEYLGFATHLVYLGPLIKEVLAADTYAHGPGSTVARLVDGSLEHHALSGIAGVANIGSARNWTGHPLGQANWYAFGRLAWDPSLRAEAVAEEWTRQTLTTEPAAVRTLVGMLSQSRRIYVRYTTPLGLHHIMGEHLHYGPEPWLAQAGRPDWTATYYHRADSLGLGFDRTATGSNALALYRPEVQRQWGNPASCPLDYLLWFHHVAWGQRLRTGRTLWDELCTRYYTGADSVRWLQRQWQAVRPALDPALHAEVAARLQTQYKEALWWRDACVLYFQTFARRPVPAPLAPPTRSLAQVKALVQVYQLN